MKQDKRDDIDTTMLMLTGFGMGALLSAIMFIFIGIFALAGDDEIWSFQALLSGLMCIGISIAIGIIAVLYWKFIASKTYVLFPELTGFKLIIAFAAVIPGAALTIALAYQCIM